ncbi:MAG: hypothetical protein K8R54_09820 [Bacteroidales bacterium]|nr:hypothetical protein [Bacteroidales bacterium]
MHIEENHIYHIYNRSNETVFYNRENYLYFLRKVNKQIRPFCEILSWCLMPNHFHFLVLADAISSDNTNETHRPNLQLLSKGFANLTSSYSQAINKQENRKGSLWMHTTKAKKLSGQIYFGVENFHKNDIIFTCFNYIHQNPVEAKLVEKSEDWEFSSFKDFMNIRNGKLVNKIVAYEIINFDKDNFYEQSKIVLDEKKLKHIF